MSIRQGLAANRSAYRDFFGNSRKEDLLLPSPPQWEEDPFVFPTVPSPLPDEPETVYRLESGASPLSSSQEPSPAPEEDQLLDRLVQRLERESRRSPQPLLDD